MNGISLFSGIGGLDLGLKEAAGVRTVCYVEWDRYCQEVLKKRMQEGYLDDAPIWSDISTFRGGLWAGRVDIVFGGFPCQDISVVGKGAGIKVGTRSGLFYELMRVVSEIRPPYLFLENVSAITNRGIDIVLGELAKEGYDARWEIVSAAEVGAPHRRERWFCLAWDADRLDELKIGGIRKRPTAFAGGIRTEKMAYPEYGGIRQENEVCAGRNAAILCSQELSNPSEPGLEGQEPEGELRCGEPGLSSECNIWRTDPADLEPSSESFVDRVAYDVPKRVDRLKCLGNAVVPCQAAEAWNRLTENLSDSASLRGRGIQRKSEVRIESND